MADVRISLHVKFANGSDAAGMDIRVIEVGGATYAVGKTGSDGRIDAVVRGRRKRRVFGRLIDDPFDHPTLKIVISDQSGHSLAIPDVQFFVLPPVFDPPPPSEAPTDPAPTAGTPSALADQALRPLVESKAPGYLFLVRKNGSEWANATRGLSRAGLQGISARALTNDTIVNLASMSKPITATALVAMVDDWTAIRDAVAALGSPGAPTQHLRLTLLRLLSARLVEVDVPVVLVPLFADRQRAAGALAVLPPAVSREVREALLLFSAEPAVVVSPAPVVPPGHLGLLRRVLDGVQVPAYGDPFLPLIQARLGLAAGAIGTGVDTITIRDLLTHRTTLIRIDGSELDPTRHTAAEIAAVGRSEPAGGVATFDYWSFVKLLLQEPSGRFAGIQYHNNNFTVLTTLVEACTETSFDDYVTGRLFSDPRFNCIRRRVVDANREAFYHGGTAPNWSGGVRFADYSNWPGNGGFYATANQLTDWLQALYTRQEVAGVGGSAPLVSAAGHASLFGATGFFSLGITNRAGPAGASQRYQHNGGASVGGGAVNGNLAIVESPSHAVYAALFVANGTVGADPPFEAAVASLPWA